MTELEPGRIVVDPYGDDYGVIEATPLNPQAQPWVNWFCHEHCRGKWDRVLEPAVHHLSGEPLFRTPFFDIKQVEMDELEAMCWL